MPIYLTKCLKLRGTDYREVSRRARRIYKEIASTSRRKPYIRSAYFKNEKVFLDYFWQHLQQKNWQDRFRRLKYYPCALEVIRYSNNAPIITRNPNNASEIFYRFIALTASKEQFCVQIKEETNNGQKHFISVFPQ